MLIARPSLDVSAATFSNLDTKQVTFTLALSALDVYFKALFAYVASIRLHALHLCQRSCPSTMARHFGVICKLTHSPLCSSLLDSSITATTQQQRLLKTSNPIPKPIRAHARLAEPFGPEAISRVVIHENAFATVLTVQTSGGRR
jgi:hypothetical protein